MEMSIKDIYANVPIKDLARLVGMFAGLAMSDPKISSVVSSLKEKFEAAAKDKTDTSTEVSETSGEVTSSEERVHEIHVL